MNLSVVVSNYKSLSYIILTQIFPTLNMKYLSLLLNAIRHCKTQLQIYYTQVPIPLTSMCLKLI